MYKKVILPVSGEEHGKRASIALKKALEVCDGMIILLHVAEAIPQTVGGSAREELVRSSEAHGQVLLEPLVEQLKTAGVHFRTLIKSGTIAETIVSVADEEKADLIVMFTDGRKDLEALFLGSIAERVLRNTGVDLLAVRNPD